MSDIAIQVEHVSKQYRLGSGASYGRFSELLVHFAKAPLRLLAPRPSPLALRPSSGGSGGDLLALDDVSFTVNRGEVMGIIGRNGAGKSTLLKILARITEPTAGEVRLRGRVGSLLEVGVGFHSELTGRENIFLNGAILGMRRAEIRKHFDSIVAFSEIERFLDTPVKRYSSGMYMRLAFAVAAHLDTEILLVDEVLAVGDASFQKKCLGKMDEVAKGGRTVLFVSHNLGAVRQLCGRGVLLDQGRVETIGPIDDVVDRYLSRVAVHETGSDMDLRHWPTRDGNGAARMVRARLLSADGVCRSRFAYGDSLTVELTIEATEPAMVEINGVCLTRYGTGALHVSHFDDGFGPQRLQGTTVVTFAIPSIQLVPGDYYWNISIHSPGTVARLDCLTEILTFTVEPGPHYRRPYTASNRDAICLPPSKWAFTNFP